MSKAQATIFGVPISWIAMVSAILAGSTVIPLFFFAGGVGYMSLGYALCPLMGLVLGPYGGFIAGLIGGTIGMFIMPAAIAGGFPQVLFDWAMPPLITGLVANRKWKIAVPIVFAGFIMYNLVPYYIPGPPAYPTPPQPAFFLAPYWYYIGGILLLLTGSKLPDWVRSDDKKKLLASLIIFEWISNEPMEALGWSYWNALLALDPNLVIWILVFNIWWQRILTLIAVGAIGVPLIEGLRKSGLRQIPGSVWSD
ncbi:MAG: hypothetical protein ACP6IU_01990 [Candidatus Asgardarchaeia archaeon]